MHNQSLLQLASHMDIDEYTRLLNSVDIAIYNNNRQQATGNIEILGFLGKKIFVRSDTTTWEHYVDRDDCRFFDTTGLASMDFLDFIKLSEDAREYNYNYFSRIWDELYLKELWDRVFEY